MSEPTLYQDTTTGIIKIKENSQYNKVDAEEVIVYPNVTARLFGNVKNVTLNKGSRLYMLHKPIKLTT